MKSPVGKSSMKFEKGPNGLMLVRIKDGVRSEMLLSGNDLIALRRLTQQTMDQILLRRFGRSTMGRSDVQASVFLPTKGVYVNTDLHKSEVLLTVHDGFGGERDTHLITN